jgi:hypothetical protein
VSQIIIPLLPLPVTPLVTIKRDEGPTQKGGEEETHARHTKEDAEDTIKKRQRTRTLHRDWG